MSRRPEIEPLEARISFVQAQILPIKWSIVFRRDFFWPFCIPGGQSLNCCRCYNPHTASDSEFATSCGTHWYRDRTWLRLCIQSFLVYGCSGKTPANTVSLLPAPLIGQIPPEATVSWFHDETKPTRSGKLFKWEQVCFSDDAADGSVFSTPGCLKGSPSSNECLYEPVWSILTRVVPPGPIRIAIVIWHQPTPSPT